MAEVVAQCAVARGAHSDAVRGAVDGGPGGGARARAPGGGARTELSFDAAADVDAARPALVEAVCGAVAAEEGLRPRSRRGERVRKLVEGLDRPRPKRGSGGRGKRREAALRAPAVRGPGRGDHPARAALEPLRWSWRLRWS